MSIESPFRSCHALKPLGFLLLLAIGCQEPAGEQGYVRTPQGAEVTSTASSDPLYSGLLNKPFPAELLPAGYTAGAAMPKKLSETSRKHNGVGKVTFELTGPQHGQLISYTVYPDSASAAAAFSEIGTTPAGWQQVKSERLSPLGLATTVWGEDSYENYPERNTSIVRTSVATAAHNAVALAQVVSQGDTVGEGVHEQVVELLKAAVRHVTELGASSATIGDAGAAVPGNEVPPEQPSLQGASDPEGSQELPATRPTDR